MAEHDLADPELYLNRELSELEFQRRVLFEAEDDRDPVLERVTSLRYFAKNTDEFFMKRIGGLKLELAAGANQPTVDGMTPEEQWHACLDRFREMQTHAYDVWADSLHPRLEEAGFRLRACHEVPRRAREQLRGALERDVLPLLTPLSYDPAHPFPRISSLSVSVAVLITGESGAPPTFTRIKVPPSLDPFMRAHDGDGELYVPIVDIICENLDLILPGRKIESVSLFRVTRSAEVKLNEEVAEDLVEHVEDVLEKRRTAPAVRLELSPRTPTRVAELLRDQLGLQDEELFRHPEPMTARDLQFLVRRDGSQHSYPAWTPQPHPRLGESERDIFETIRRGDLLIHHPYHSFEETTQAFLDAAARDERVRAIKIAIYRTANDSKVIRSLVEAAERGKQVAAIVELKARLDERRNVEWVRRLEREGIHVAYGMIKRKTHTKLALVVREEEEGLRFYSHVGTGNYHSGTAKAYVDLGLLTADQDVGHDVMRVFNIFTGP
ncbi:MAG: polyphosphate kinase 1, partial [Spirochaetota bacterium]